MKKLREFDIKFEGLKLGQHTFNFEINKTFFETFNYEDFEDAKVNVKLLFDKKSTFFELTFAVDGEVNVPCDVSNELYWQTLNNQLKLIVKFGEEYNDEHDEILILPHEAYKIDVSQYVYEAVILAVPTKKVHPNVLDGTLQTETLDKLNQLKVDQKSFDIDPRWDKLKNLITDKKV